MAELIRALSFFAMSELVTGERLQPCLLDRLTDLEPGNKEESRFNRVISMARYRNGVLRDLRWLLGTSKHLESENLKEFPSAAVSGLNLESARYPACPLEASMSANWNARSPKRLLPLNHGSIPGRSR